jgi:hypothetical protein
MNMEFEKKAMSVCAELLAGADVVCGLRRKQSFDCPKNCLITIALKSAYEAGVEQERERCAGIANEGRLNWVGSGPEQQ